MTSTSDAAKNLRAAPTVSRSSSEPQIFSGVSTRNFTRVPAAYKASSCDVALEPSSLVFSFILSVFVSIDATVRGRSVNTFTALSRISAALFAVVSMANKSSAVAIASR